MPILDLGLCAAAAVTGGLKCVGPVDAVRCVKATGEVTGCVLHAAMLKALLVDVRFYAGTVDGAAIAAFYLAEQVDRLYTDPPALRALARTLLVRYSRNPVLAGER